MSSRATLHVAVVAGGPSAERGVSLSSGRECAAALRGAGFRVTEIDAGHSLAEDLKALSPDVAFNVLHGRWGEDGCVQGLLEWLRIPYTHSGVLSSALAMDKQLSKAAFASAGLPVAEGRRATRDEIEAGHLLPLPYVVKPVSGGSSVGVTIVREAMNAARVSPDAEGPLMVEAFAPGRELTVTVMDGRALTVTDILCDGWYDFSAKYEDGGSRHVLPADVPPDVFGACLDYAFRAHEALGCRGVSRADFRWDEDRGVDGLILLEINTQPGMTRTSLTPEQAAHRGVSFPELVTWMVEDASCDR